MEEYSIKSIRDDFKKKGVFYTPPQLGKFILSLIKWDIKEAYDPTCGRGSLLSIFPESVTKYGQEIDADAVKDAKEHLVNSDIRQGDTIHYDAFPEREFDLIVANPPFSIRYEEADGMRMDARYWEAPCLPPQSKADYLFILHILHKLSENGTAFVLEFPGILYRGNKEGQIRNYLIDCNVIDAIYQIPPKQFTDTSIATCLIVFKKNRKNAETIKMVDVENGLSRDVPIREILENDGNLSVSSYVIKEEEHIEQDPIELQEKSHKAELNILRSNLKFTKLICEMEGIDFGKYLDDFQSIIEEFRK